MDCIDKTTISTQTTYPHSSDSAGGSPRSILAAPPSPPPQVILTPCAACKILRRRCVDKCVLAPYFPPTEPLKFTIAHRVFGASNIIKLLQELPEDQRADTVNSMVYEANARIRDPVYGCAGAIFQLQKQISELQADLAKAQVEILHVQNQNTNLVALICAEMTQYQENDSSIVFPDHQQAYGNSTTFPEDDNVYAAWEPL
ncbi:LOB domain-containing protein 1-like [Lycium ferocissimum]|uniref:LOB domain-containing protein 1-like n=1 Tax=Lycium ferocissimum TaxID=112874 RepID=UPI002814F501|nr:LOB domain-containing protein 1-like [Lycium ferocissimum]